MCVIGAVWGGGWADRVSVVHAWACQRGFFAEYMSPGSTRVAEYAVLLPTLQVACSPAVTSLVYLKSLWKDLLRGVFFLKKYVSSYGLQGG